jgi:hypothetical protein
VLASFHTLCAAVNAAVNASRSARWAQVPNEITRHVPHW